MKKMFFALAALVLAFTGCSQEDEAIQANEKKAFKVVVNMDKPGFGEDTRAARQGWEEDDQVVVMLGNDLEYLIGLTYNGTSWQETVLSFDGEEWVPNPEAAEEYLASLSDGNLKAAYFSSGGIYFMPIPEDATTAAALTGIDIYSAAREGETAMGECVMTCEDGTYSVSEGELTLDITMKPQVAQFTIRDLAVGTDENAGKTSEGLEVAVAGGNLIAYAGGTITSSGIELNRVNYVGYYNACWVHHNVNGISIYASVDAEYEFTPNDTHYTFSVGDDCRNFDCDTYKTKISNGAAIIMDGPETSGAEDKWAPGE